MVTKPSTLLPTGQMHEINVIGRIDQRAYGFDRSSASFSVVNDYGTVQPSGAVNLYQDAGVYYFTVRTGTKLQGR